MGQRQRYTAFDRMLLEKVAPDGNPLSDLVVDNLMGSVQPPYVTPFRDLSTTWDRLRGKRSLFDVIGTAFFHGIIPAENMPDRAVFVAHMLMKREASLLVRPVAFPLLIVNEIADSKGHMPDAARAEYVKARNALLMAEKPKSPLN